MNKRGLIGSIVLVLILFVVGFFWFAGEWNSGVSEKDSCVPDSCCHAKGCVWESVSPNCSGRLCSSSCEPGTLDCGQGSCEVVEGNCKVVWNE